MNSPDPVTSPPIDRLRARLLRLATDPRAGMLPEGRPTLRELVAVLDQVAELELRVAALEQCLSRMIRPAEVAFHDS